MAKVKTISIMLTVEIAETLHGLIDGCIGGSDSDDFNAQMVPVRKLLEKKIKEANSHGNV